MLDKTFSLRSYVINLFDDGADDEGVVDTLVTRASSNADLRNALVLVGAKQAVRTYFNDARSEAAPIRGARSEATRETKIVERGRITKAEREARMAAKENRRTTLDTYTLWGHTALRDATREDLRVSIANRKTQLAGGVKAIRFEGAVLAQLPDDRKTCGQVFSASRIDKMWMRYYGR